MPQLQCLLDKCLAAFGNYAREVRTTFGLLSDLENYPASLEWLLAIAEQTQVEDRAQQAYLLLRQQLFELEIMKFVDQGQTETEMAQSGGRGGTFANRFIERTNSIPDHGERHLGG